MNRIGRGLGGFLATSIVLVYIWGIGWSFHRHGADQAALAFMIPPYGVYRGVASIWDEPEWKEKYDVRTEQLAIAIEHSGSDSRSDRLQSVEENHRLRDWMKQVPPDEREKLKEASWNYRLALVGCSRAFASSLISNRVDVHPCQNPDVQEKLAAFQSIPGFKTSWSRFVQTVDSDAKAAAVLGHDSEMDTGVQERLETWLRTMNTKMNATLAEIFSDP